MTRTVNGLTAYPQSSNGMDTWSRLTTRERDVLDGIACGQSNREIAVSLGIGIGTVKAHVKRLFLKLGVHDRVVAPLVAVGLIEQASQLSRGSRGRRRQHAA